MCFTFLEYRNSLILFFFLNLYFFFLIEFLHKVRVETKRFQFLRTKRQQI